MIASPLGLGPPLRDHGLPDLRRPGEGLVIGGAALGQDDLLPLPDDELPAAVALVHDALRELTGCIRQAPGRERQPHAGVTPVPPWKRASAAPGTPAAGARGGRPDPQASR